MPQFTLDDKTINFSDSGSDGAPVILIHAFPMNSGMWAPQFDALGDAYRMIAPDLSGFGGSSAPEDRSAYSVDTYAGEIAGLMDHLSIERATIVGLSMGGYISFALHRKHPERFEKLVLADTRAEADPPEGIEKRSNQQKLVADEGTGGLIGGLAGALLGESTRANKPDVVERSKALMDNPAAGFIGALEAMKQRPDSTGDLAGINVPTLIVVGEEDGVTPPEAARAMHERISGSQLVSIPGCGHLSSLEAPEIFNGALNDFLK